MKLLKNLQNELDFFLRSRIKFSKKYKGENEAKEGLFNHFPEQKRKTAKEKEKLYLKKYRLENLKNNSTQLNYLENLVTIELLEKYLKVDKQKPAVLDIGSKNWFYAKGEYNFFRYNNFEKEIRLDGIEIDAFRIYLDLCTRYDYAVYYTQGLENCRYLPKNLLNHRKKYDYITWFFPFLTEYPLLKWGLPLSVFKPVEMLEHAVSLLNPDGQLLIVNQDENEYSIQEQLIQNQNLNYIKAGVFNNSFLDYEHKRYVTLIHIEKGNF